VPAECFNPTDALTISTNVFFLLCPSNMLLFDATHRSLKPVVAELQHAGRKGRSRALYQQCIDGMQRARELEDDAAFVLIAQTFGLVIDQDGYSDASIAWLSEAAERAQRCGEFGEQSHMLHLIGRAYYSRAEYGVAMGYWTEGMELALRDGDRISWSWCKLGMGQICDALGAPDLAVLVFARLGQTLATLNSSAQRLPMSQWARFDMRLRELRAVNMVNLGVNELELGDYEPALAHLREGMVMAQAEQMNDIAAECLVRFAEISALQGQPATALLQTQEAQRALEDCSHHWGLATLFLLRAKCQSALGQVQEASAALDLARAAAQRANAQHIALRIEQEDAAMAEKYGDLPRAIASMKRAAALQASLDQGGKAHMLRRLQALADVGSNAAKESPAFQFGGRWKPEY
jgi:two-component system NtrC family sensor kinase